MATQGIVEVPQLSNDVVTVLYPYLREVFINETPLAARTPREVADAQVYEISSYDVRPRIYTLAAAFTASAADVDITLTDASPIMVGDVLEVLDTAGTASERVEVVSVPASNVFNVRRAREGTAVIANTAGGSAGSLVVTLIGNSRTGAEIDQQAHRAARSKVEQYVQTFQVPVQVGGLADAVRNVRLPAGFSSVFSLEQKVGMTEFMRDLEYAMYFGLGEKPTAAGDRAKMKGLRKLISGYQSGANVNLSGGASYTLTSFVAAVQKCLDGGGNPDVCICAPNLMTGLHTWGFAKQQINAPRANAIGLPINEVVLPFLSGPITFIPSYQLPAGTFTILTSSDVIVRYIRDVFWQPRGLRGDAKEGDIIGDACIEVGHPGWHQWTSGITSWA